MPTTSRSNSGGFTLIEMLMAMLVMTVGLLGLLQSVNIAYEQSRRNKVREIAVLVAEEQMNDWRRLSFPNMTAGRFADSSSFIDKTMSGAPMRFTILRRNDAMGSGPSGNYRRLKVEVEWRLKDQLLNHKIYALKNR